MNGRARLDQDSSSIFGLNIGDSNPKHKVVYISVFDQHLPNSLVKGRVVGNFGDEILITLSKPAK